MGSNVGWQKAWESKEHVGTEGRSEWVVHKRQGQ